jgi:hypothetical protein
MTDNEYTKYIAFVEADAGLSVEATSKEHAESKLEDIVDTGHLGPPKIRSVEEF